MVDINLLPWREYKKIYEKKVAMIFLMSAILVSIIILLPAHFFVWSQVNRYAIKTEKLKDQVQLNFGEKLATIAPNYISPAALSYRQATQTLLRGLGAAQPTAACFTSISRHANAIQFAGNTRSAADLAAFLKSWQAGGSFSQIMIDELKQQTGSTLMQFRFHGYEQQILDGAS